MSEEKTRCDSPAPEGGEGLLSSAGEPDAADFEQASLAYEPAGPVKRALAWIGVVYMLILTALNLYAIYTGGALHGLAPLLAVPGLAGLGGTALIAHRANGRPSAAAAWVIAAICWLLAVLLLFPGIAGLMANFS